ncbi:PKD domain-containing protein [Agrococcus sp. ProA11]|uniref:PKD domain-containing protein n=1 Tax=Agrococcus chionoecetis TaxID=3153752 RepID=UPI003260F4A3
MIAAGAMLLTGVTAVSAADGDVPPGPVTLQQRTDGVVTADPLPTVQIDNGYVWAQAMIGNTVYAVGGFENARAPLASPGTNLTPRSNILAYDITNGNLLPFAPQVNGVIRAVAASPDGSRIYIGGSFNTVNGETRWNFAALNAATGQLVPGFNPAIGGSGVYAMAVMGDTVYMTGLFSQANGVARTNLAAFDTTNGALRPWAPTTDRQGDAMVIDPGGAHVIAAGRFYLVNGVVQRGLVALDPITGAIDTEWAASDTVINGWSSGSAAGKAGIFALAVDDSGVYGTGWVYANTTVGNLEGVFAAEAGTGEIRWIADCHGDHYGVWSTGEIVYATSHTHECDTVGLAPELSPRTYRYVEAFSATAEGTLTRSPSVSSIYKDWSGTPAPQPYAWYPDFLIGHTSGLNQAGLSMTGTGQYLAVAGEFVGVNNQRYEGIVRFSTAPPGGPKQGPRIASSAWGAPTASSTVAGRVRISMPSNWDRDDRDLTYELRRTGTPGVVQSQVVGSGWWPQSQPRVLFNDTGLTPGATYTYTVRAVDGDGNAVTSQPVTVTVGNGTPSDYVNTVLDDGASIYYPLGTIGIDYAGGGNPVFGSNTSSITPGAVAGVTGETATNFGGNSNGRVSSPSSGAVTSEFSAEAWFRTSTNQGGKIIGFGNSQTGSSASYDRHVYMQNNGRLTFGVYPGGVRTVNSTQSYNDGQWHHAVATQSAEGMRLYVDGALVGSDPSTVAAQAYNGYWRIGGDNLNGWPNRPSSNFFNGRIDEVAVYPTALTSGQVMSHYTTGLGQEAPTAAFISSTDDLTATFDGTASTADTGATIASYSWNYGDGTPTGSGAAPTHTYATAGTYAVTLTVTDSRGVSGAVTHDVTVLAANQSPTASFTTSADGMAVAVNGVGSSDPDGSIASYSWNWGDGTADGSGTTASHAYATPGERTITLTVTDNRGATGTTTRQVTASHADPTASFTATASGLRVDVDAAASSASDGATLSYAWNWGDGATGSGMTANHTYAAGGTYTITVTVTDSLGGTATTTRELTVSQIAFAARDDFERTVSAGWGDADTGGTWTPMHGSAAVATVAGGDGILTLSANQTRNMALQGLSVADSSTTVTYAIDQAPATGSSYVGIAARQSASQNYTVRAWMRSNGTVWLVAQRSGSSTVLSAVPLGLNWTAGEELQLRVQVSGSSPTTIQAKAWPASGAEPADWQLSTTDSTAGLQGSGWVSLHANRAGSATSTAAFSFDGLRVTDPNTGGGPVNADPTASFTSTVSDLQVAVDGGASSDADGSIASYSWSWGDGTPNGSGETANHSYAAAGTYTVALTVTDDDGATATTSSPVTVTAAPGGNAAPTASFTAAMTDLDLSVDAAASADSDGTITSYSWNWGDGTTAGTGATAIHSYAAAGTYTVTLTVTDDDGATATTTRSVEATDPVVPPGDFAASDDFGRTVAQGWGTADVGGAWGVESGSSAPLSVSGGTGVLTLGAGSTRNVLLSDADLQDVRVSVDFSLDQAPSTGSAFFGVIARSTGGDDYRVRTWLRDNGTVWLVLQHGRTVLSTYPVPGLTRAAGDSFTLAAEVTGSTSTTFSASIWRTGTPEPATWQVVANDAAGPDASGAVGVHSNRSGSASTTGVFTVDAFRVTDLG